MTWIGNIHDTKSRMRDRVRLNRTLRRTWCVTFAAFAIFLMLLALPACTKRKESPPSNENSAGVPATPPANNSAANNSTANNAGAPAANNNPAPAPAQPEAPAQPQPIIVPAGTALTVRLTDALGSKTSQAGQTFGATLDKDVIVDGQTAIPAGANVSGSVMSARSYGKLAGEANLVLRLKSVNINNVDQAIVTSARSFGPKIKAKGAVRKFFGGLAKRAEGDEREVDLAAQSAYTFTLRQALEIQ